MISKEISFNHNEDFQKYKQAIQFLESEESINKINSNVSLFKEKNVKGRILQKIKKSKEEIKKISLENLSLMVSPLSAKETNPEKRKLFESLEKLSKNSSQTEVKIRDTLSIHENDMNIIYSNSEWEYNDFHEIYNLLKLISPKYCNDKSKLLFAAELRFFVNFIQILNKKGSSTSLFCIPLKSISTIEEYLLKIYFSYQFESWQAYLNQSILMSSKSNQHQSSRKGTKKRNKIRMKAEEIKSTEMINLLSTPNEIDIVTNEALETISTKIIDNDPFIEIENIPNNSPIEIPKNLDVNKNEIENKPISVDISESEIENQIIHQDDSFHLSKLELDSSPVEDKKKELFPKVSNNNISIESYETGNKSQIEILSEEMKKMKSENEELLRELYQLKEKVNKYENPLDQKNDNIPLSLDTTKKSTQDIADMPDISSKASENKNIDLQKQIKNQNINNEFTYNNSGYSGINSASSVCSINSEPYSEDESGSISSQWLGWPAHDFGFQHHFYQHQHHHAAGLLSANPWQSHHQHSQIQPFVTNFQQYVPTNQQSSPPPQFPYSSEWNQYYGGNHYRYYTPHQSNQHDFYKESRLSSRSSGSSVVNQHHYYNLPPMPHEWHGRENLNNESNPSNIKSHYTEIQSPYSSAVATPSSTKRRNDSKPRNYTSEPQNLLNRTLSGTITLNGSINSSNLNKSSKQLDFNQYNTDYHRKNHYYDDNMSKNKYVQSSNNQNCTSLKMTYQLPSIPHSVHSLVKITQVIRSFEQYCKDKRQERLMYENEVLLKMRSIVCGVWPRARVLKFGSCATGLTLPNSDMDLVICLPRVMSDAVKKEVGPLEGTVGGESQNALLWQEKLKAALLLSPLVNKDTLKTIIHAPVPIISLEFNTKIPIRVDISIETASHRGVAASKFINGLLRENPMLQPLVLILKRFISEKGYGIGYSGGLSSYALTLIVACFLGAINQGYIKSKSVSKNDAVLTSSVNDTHLLTKDLSSKIRGRSASVTTFPVVNNSKDTLMVIGNHNGLKSNQVITYSINETTNNFEGPSTSNDRKTRVSFDDDMVTMIKDREKIDLGKKDSQELILTTSSSSLSPAKRITRSSSGNVSSKLEIETPNFIPGNNSLHINSIDEYEIGSLFIRFLHFFGDIFNPKTTGISITKSFFNRYAPIYNGTPLSITPELIGSPPSSQNRRFHLSNRRKSFLIANTQNDLENEIHHSHTALKALASLSIQSPMMDNQSLASGTIIPSPQIMQLPPTAETFMKSPNNESSNQQHHQQQSTVFRYDPLQIEDPLQPGNNVGRNCFRIYQIQREFHSAGSLIDKYNEIEGDNIIKTILGKWGNANP